MGNIDPTLVWLIGGGLCFVCAGTFASVGLLILVARIRGQGESAWKVFATKHGLTYQPEGFLAYGYGTMSGQIDGQNITFRSYSTGGRHSVRWTAVYVPIQNPKGLLLMVGAKGFDGTVYKAFGAQDIAIGLKDFDDKFTIQTNPPELASKILLHDAELRAAINAVSPYELLYKDKGSSCRVLGSQKDETVLLNLLHLARKFAEAVENSG